MRAARLLFSFEMHVSIAIRAPIHSAAAVTLLLRVAAVTIHQAIRATRGLVSVSGPSDGTTGQRHQDVVRGG